jgi:hypothetical protein
MPEMFPDDEFIVVARRSAVNNALESRTTMNDHEDVGNRAVTPVRTAA